MTEQPEHEEARRLVKGHRIDGNKAEHEEARRLAELERGIREEFYADRRELGDDEAVRHIVGAFARTQSLLAKAEQERDDLRDALENVLVNVEPLLRRDTPGFYNSPSWDAISARARASLSADTQREP